MLSFPRGHAFSPEHLTRFATDKIVYVRAGLRVLKPQGRLPHLEPSAHQALTEQPEPRQGLPRLPAVRPLSHPYSLTRPGKGTLRLSLLSMRALSRPPWSSLPLSMGFPSSQAGLIKTLALP